MRRDDGSGQRTTRSQLSGLTGFIRVCFLVVFPGLVAAVTLIPVITLGPLAFSIRNDFPVSVASIGFSYTAYFIVSTILTSVGGWLVGRHTTLVIVRVGLVCSAVLAVCMSAATAGVHLLVVASCAGAVNGLVTPALNVMITRWVPEQLRGLAFGVKVAAAPGAAALAALGGWAAASFDTPWQGIYWLCAGLGVLTLCATYPLGRGEDGEGEARPRGASEARRRPPRSLVWLAIGGFLGAAGTAVLPPFLVDGLMTHGLTAGNAASWLALGSGLGFLSRILVGGLSDRWPNPLLHLHVVVGMMVVSAGSMLALAFGTVHWVLLAGTVCAFTIGWAWPGLVHYAAIATHRGSEARATTYMQSGTFLGSVVGPTGFGLLADYESFAAAWTVSGAAVLGAAVLLTLGVRSLRQQALSSRSHGPSTTINI